MELKRYYLLKLPKHFAELIEYPANKAGDFFEIFNERPTDISPPVGH